MIVVKITILAVMVTALYIWIWRAWLKSNAEEAIKFVLGKNYVPKGGYPLFVLLLIDVIGVFASVIWALFFR